VRSTNSGVSAFIDPVGRITQHTEPFKAQALVENIAWLQASTPYELWGDVPWWAASLAIVAMGFISKRKRLPMQADQSANSAPVAGLPPTLEPADLPQDTEDFRTKSRAWFQRARSRSDTNE
jgi:apolipoprotein N-acyltransferase